jgi:hypothetical protein
MTRRAPHELLRKGLITQAQFDIIEPIVNGKIISVFYELRTLLYLGVMLFTTGAGLIIYKNIGSLGHMVSLAVLTMIMVISFAYTFKREVGYSHQPVKPPTPYYDYVVLTGCLLFLSIQGYIQFQYGAFSENLGWNTVITAIFFFYIAYRFDHVGILSLAITALASFFSISVSPQKWYSGEFFSASNLYQIAILFSIVVGGVAFFLDSRQIKKHFTYTYLNFCFILFFCGTIIGLLMPDWWLYLLLIYGGSAAAFYIARSRKSFLFLLYAFVASYIATTSFLARTIFETAPVLWFLYSLLSCAGFVYFIIRYKTFFKQ